MKNKLLLFLIITAMLASYRPVFAENADIFFTDDVQEETAIDDIAIEAFEEEIDLMPSEEEAQLNGEPIAWDGVTIAQPPQGEDGAYEISNGAQLAWAADQVNSHTDSNGRYGGLSGTVIRLVEDIDLGGFPWTPIGRDYNTPFAGELDGDGHSVYGLDFNAADHTNCGLFGCVLGYVHDLGVSTAGAGIVTRRHVTPAGADHTRYGVGIVAGSVDERIMDFDNKLHSGAIERCTAKGSLTVSNDYGEDVYIGGVAGVNSGGSLIDNVNEADVTFEGSKNTERAFVGGITGCNYGVTANSEDFAPVIEGIASISVTSANPYIGAAAGGNSGEIRNLRYSGERLSIGTNNSAFSAGGTGTSAGIGGITGLNSGRIIGCSYTGDLNLGITRLVDQTRLCVGGITGTVTDHLAGEVIDERRTGGIIDECSVSGSIAIEADAMIDAGLIAGLVTDETASVTDCSVISSALSVSNAAAQTHAGAIAGETSCVIDGCAVSGSSVTAQGSAPISAGGIAGAAFNTITDCTARADVTVNGSDDENVMFYAGGIAGEAYGNILRSHYLGGAVTNKGRNAYAGGIAGIAALGEYSVISGETPYINRCRFGSDASVECSYISGGISGYASRIDMDEVLSEGTLMMASASDGEAAVSAAGGIIGTAGSSVNIVNCLARPKINAYVSNGAAYAVTGTGNTLSDSYLAPEFTGSYIKNAVSSPENTAELAIADVYFNSDRGGMEPSEDGIKIINDEEAASRAVFAGVLDLSNKWVMGKTSPELQFTYYSNARAKMTDADLSELTFHVTLENPQEGQHIYVALYNKEGRFCGTASAVCGGADMSLSGTKAEFALTYSYDYWFNPKNYDENGDPKPGDEWIPSEFVPATAKAFTWDEENGLKNLSSVEINGLDIEFE